MYKCYAIIEFELESPLSVGSGKNEETDKDVIKDIKGNPVIPASSFAGVYRSFFGEKDQNKYFGFVKIKKDIDKNINDENKQSEESKVIIYDAVLCEGEKAIYSIRNGVGLNDYKTTIKGAKFDYEVIEPEVRFWTAIELTFDNTDEFDKEKVMNTILSAWNNGQIIVGGKSTRGLGKLKAEKIRYKEFDLSNEKELEDWLSFDLFSNSDREGINDWNKKSDIKAETFDKAPLDIDISIEQAGPLTVRVYTTNLGNDGEVAPDYSQLVYKKKDNSYVAVVPGTTWAGAFRHSMDKYLKGTDCNLTDLFGTEKNGGTKSKIVFSETYFSDGESKVVSRNAINRFSGGASDTALFTEKMYFGGTDGNLKITLPHDSKDAYIKALAATVADLGEGFLSVGGETSIGHGLFRVKSIIVNGECRKGSSRSYLSGEEIYNHIINIVNLGRGGI